MQEISKEMQMEKIEKHIGVLDGVRAFAIIFVVWFHFWQQSWVTPRITVPLTFSRITGLTEINLEGFVRYGFLFVDLLILLSAFCNFYPYARSILLGEEWPDWKQFYLKRAIRILPSYYLCILIMLVISLAGNAYAYDGTMYLLKDLFMHLTFTSVFFPTLHLRTKLGIVLWTVQMEILYYLVLPLIAKAFRRKPVMTVTGLWILSWVSIQYFSTWHAEDIRLYVNNIFSFACYYANGMLLCIIYIRLKQNGLPDLYGRIAGTVGFFFSIWGINYVVHELGRADAQGMIQVRQLQLRFFLSVIFSIGILGLVLSMSWIQLIFSNWIMRFLCAISYNLYIWHQTIAVWMKQYRIPYWEGDTSPNILGDKVWMMKYQILIVVVSVLAAAVLTYGFERPAAKYLKKKLKL